MIEKETEKSEKDGHNKNKREKTTKKKGSRRERKATTPAGNVDSSVNWIQRMA